MASSKKRETDFGSVDENACFHSSGAPFRLAFLMRISSSSDLFCYLELSPELVCEESVQRALKKSDKYSSKICVHWEDVQVNLARLRFDDSSRCPFEFYILTKPSPTDKSGAVFRSTVQPEHDLGKEMD
jgi:hypothetical protein